MLQEFHDKWLAKIVASDGRVMFLYFSTYHVAIVTLHVKDEFVFLSSALVAQDYMCHGCFKTFMKVLSFICYSSKRQLILG